jgi:DNA-binding GntR family transcriptional regulator
MLLPVFGYLVSLEKVPIVGSVSHLDLVNILRNGSKEEFRKAMAKHLEHHFKKIRKK